jgi:hypothetical protein
MLQAIVNLLKILPSLISGIKRIIKALKLLALKRREKRLDNAIEEAKKEKSTEDLQKEIGKLID